MMLHLIFLIILADTAALLIGFVLDLLTGDPIGRFHPVCLIGRLISALEKKLRRPDDTVEAQRKKGVYTVICVLLATAVISQAVLYGGAYLISFLLHVLDGGLTLSLEANAAGILKFVTGIAGEHGSAIFMISYLIVSALITDATLASRDLRKESMCVYDALESGCHEGAYKEEDLNPARKALSRIVGRDTENLDEAGIIRAAVETVAENANDGVIAPIFYLCIGGPVMAMIYKAINTMDSMLGYKNEKYLHFGKAAARLDDAAGFLPARIAALLWILTSFLSGADGKGAWRIWRRDRFNHESPNSAQTESACAGSLGLQLAGDAYYFGKKKEKPTIGDPVREIEKKDIIRANRLMYGTSFLALWCALAIRGVVLTIVYRMI